MSLSPALVHLQNLLRIDTSNPPGRERAALDYLAGVLKQAGIPFQLQETAPDRGNLVARLKGDGSQRPLLLSSHVDVVPAEAEHWSQPPFSGVIEKGFIYGRGAIDMKNFTAMTLAVILKAHSERWPLKRDIIFCAVSDEENGSEWGMKALVDQHPDWVDAEFALSEVGAYTTWIGGRPFYPIQTGEKGVIWLEVEFRGQTGHGSVPRLHNAHWKLGEFLQRIRGAAFPHHPSASAMRFAEEMATTVPLPLSLVFRAMKYPWGPRFLKAVLEKGQNKVAPLIAMVTNTVNPTGTQSGHKTNVVPSSAKLILDCRIVPGQDLDSLLREIQVIAGQDFSVRVLNEKRGHEVSCDTELFRILKNSLERAHPGAKAVPWLTVGFTDAYQLQRIGVQCYGFTPVQLPEDIDFSLLYHGHDERIPVEGFDWGLRVLEDVVKEFVCAGS